MEMKKVKEAGVKKFERPFCLVMAAIASLVICGLFLTGSRTAGAQETRATLGGKVLDSTGAAVSHATVRVVQDETGLVETTLTNQTGDWLVRSLLPGHYHFSIEAQGFETWKHTSIELELGDQKFVDAHLKVGASSETVTVTAETPLIDTTAQVSGVVITQKEVEELPQYGDVALELSILSPGVSGSNNPSAAGMSLWGNNAASDLGVNNSSGGTRAINYTLNGATNTIAASGEVAYLPPMDSVSEMRIQSDGYDASIGRSSAATINLQTKSGTKNFHGTLYEKDENNFMNANYSQYKGTTTTTPAFHTNQWGAGVGGPVLLPKLRHKTFFFFDYAGENNKSPGSMGYMSLPTKLEKQGDFSQSYTTSTSGGVTTKYMTTLYDPRSIVNVNNVKSRSLLNGDGKVIPSGFISQAAEAYLAYLPDPEFDSDGTSSDSNNYVKKETYDDKFNTEDLRVDHQWNNNHRSYVNLRRNWWQETGWDPFGPNNILNVLYQQRMNYGLTLDHTAVFHNNLIADLRYNLTAWDDNQKNGSAGVSPTVLGYSDSNPYVTMQQLPSLPLVTGIVGGAETGGLGTDNAGNYENDTTQEANITITQSHRNHVMNYGMQFILLQSGQGALGTAGGSFSFDNAWTDQNPDTSACGGCGNAIASMLLDLPDGGSIPYNSTSFWSQHYWGFYFQDTWRATNKLTINAGLRWDYERPVTERYNRFWNRWNPDAPQDAVTAVAQAGYARTLAAASSNPGSAMLEKFRPDPSTFVVKGGIDYAGWHGTSRYSVNPRYKYFQPRLGFAYVLRPGLVLRGGLGRFVQSSWGTGSQEGYSATTPFEPTLDDYMTINSTFSDPYSTGRTVLPTGNSLGEQTNVGSHASYNDPNIGRPYVDEASLDLQQQIKDILFQLGFTLNITRGLGMGFMENKPALDAWYFENTPTFDATGMPIATLAGNQNVPNPFLGAPYITNGVQKNQTVTSHVLLDPMPVNGTTTLTMGKGKTIYYALNTKVERRFRDGFSLHQAFTWSKRIDENAFIGNQIIAVKIDKSLSTGDTRFNYKVAPIYELPFGKNKSFFGNSGKVMNELIGGWEVTAIYNFLSGTPLSFPTNSSFYEGGDPSLGSKKTKTHWFDTSKFAPFPGTSITPQQLATQWPSWTGVLNMPGASYIPPNVDTCKSGCNGVYQDFATWNTYNQHTFGDIRNPWVTVLSAGVRKSFPIREGVRFQMLIDAYNALNHPQFGNINTSPGNQYFGWVNGSNKPTQINTPRTIQFQGKLYF